VALGGDGQREIVWPSVEVFAARVPRAPATSCCSAVPSHRFAGARSRS